MPSLHTYLKDHYAGSTGGASLARRMARVSDDAEDSKSLSSLAAEIEEDRERLREIMDRLGVRPSRVKQVGAWMGEKAGRGKLRASSPEGRVLQFEGLIMGVSGKLQLWRSLIELAGETPGLDSEELRELARRGEAQRAQLEKLHARAAKKLGG
jgi:hypothetical protein